MARLAKLLIEKKEFFFPVADHIMTNPKDREKPGSFLHLFPSPLSRLLMVLLWKINMEQEGDAVVLTNVWLMEFANIDAKSLRKYREYLCDHKMIHAKKLGSGRQYLYRAVDGKGKPLDGLETNTQVLARLSDPKIKTEIIRARVAKRFRKAVTREADIDAAMPASWGVQR